MSIFHFSAKTKLHGLLLETKNEHKLNQIHSDPCEIIRTYIKRMNEKNIKGEN